MVPEKFVAYNWLPKILQQKKITVWPKCEFLGFMWRHGRHIEKRNLVFDRFIFMERDMRCLSLGILLTASGLQPWWMLLSVDAPWVFSWLLQRVCGLWLCVLWAILWIHQRFWRGSSSSLHSSLHHWSLCSRKVAWRFGALSDHVTRSWSRGKNNT